MQRAGLVPTAHSDRAPLEIESGRERSDVAIEWYLTGRVEAVGVVKSGRGQPLTLFAPGGNGERLVHRTRYADRVKGTKIGFAYERSGHFEALARVRRQAERDAGEVRAVADEHHITRAIGFSRAARAIAGALAEDESLFERVALVLPPGGHAAGSTRRGWRRC
jgi:hypothetical protein